MATKRKRSNRFKVGPAPSSRGFEDTPENRQRIKDLGYGSILDDAGGDAAGGKKRVFKPRPRNRRPGLGAGGSPSKRTRGYRRPKKKDYTKDLPRPTKSISSEIDVGIDSKPVIASTPEEAPLMPTRPPSEPAPRGTTQAGIKPAGKPDLSDTPPQDPFTKGATSPEFKAVDTDPFVGGMAEWGAPMREQPPITVSKAPEVPTTPLGGTYTPAGATFFPQDEPQPTTLPAPAGSPIPIKKENPVYFPGFHGEAPEENPPAFGFRNADGSLLDPETTQWLLKKFTPEELRKKFGDAVIRRELEDLNEPNPPLSIEDLEG